MSVLSGWVLTRILMSLGFLDEIRCRSRSWSRVFLSDRHCSCPRTAECGRGALEVPYARCEEGQVLVDPTFRLEVGSELRSVELVLPEYSLELTRTRTVNLVESCLELLGLRLTQTVVTHALVVQSMANVEGISYLVRSCAVDVVDHKVLDGRVIPDSVEIATHTAEAGDFIIKFFGAHGGKGLGEERWEQHERNGDRSAVIRESKVTYKEKNKI